ncbi:hypothetical protein D9M72_591610 [compost metagenome]
MGGERRQRRKQGHRLEARHPGVSALARPAEADRQPICQEIGVEQTAFRRQRQLLVKFETGRPVGRLVGVAPGGDMLSATGKKCSKPDLACHLNPLLFSL